MKKKCVYFLSKHSLGPMGCFSTGKKAVQRAMREILEYGLTVDIGNKEEALSDLKLGAVSTTVYALNKDKEEIKYYIQAWEVE